ncbi:MAG: type II toxin-antitoxin system prevent-host-death family antitoxin [Deltaproteobacteria bacterium]|nr:type II toxin-antitoxin system prevent-host-death family antitoxin [Deltaproteobacteria bacterium]MBI4374619.1 type II toxin-antitoxin system prevent-host-death family antitoxin [Deltaproteobacteria bacterium]
METQITALEMRRKFGGILDRVVQKGDHITIMRGNRPLATLVPAQEHEEQCPKTDRPRNIREVLGKIDEWRKRNQKALRRIKEPSEKIIRRMRDSR